MWAKEQKDPAKAKQILLGSCGVKADVEGNRPDAACRTLFEEKLITDATEAAGLCKKVSIACDAVVLGKVLSEDQIWQLCTETLPACSLGMGEVTTDPEHKAEVEFLSTIFVIRQQVTQAATAPPDGASPAKGPKVKLPKLGQPECDAIASAVNAAPRCSKSASLLPALQGNVIFLAMPWKDISPPRKKVMAEKCTEVGKDLPAMLAELCK